MKNILKAVLTLLVVSLISTLSVFGVHALTEPIITKRNESAANEVLIQMVEGADSAVNVTKDYQDYASSEITGIYEIRNGSQVLAYGFNVNTTGYHSGLIYSMAISASDDSILGWKVISHSETGNIGGALVESEEFQNQFKDFTIDSAVTEIDYVISNSAAQTIGGVRASFQKVINYYKTNMKKIDVMGENLATLGFEDGAVFTNKTDEMKAALEAVKDSINNYTNRKANYVTAYYEVTDASNNVIGHVYRVEFTYIATESTEYKIDFLFGFDQDGLNSKLKLLEVHDSWESSTTYDKSQGTSLLNSPWIENFVGKDITTLVTSTDSFYTSNTNSNSTVDFITGVSATTQPFRNHLSTAIIIYLNTIGGAQ